MSAQVVETEYEPVIEPVGFYHDPLINSIAICMPDYIGGGLVNSELQSAYLFLAERPLGITGAELTDKVTRPREFTQMAPYL